MRAKSQLLTSRRTLIKGAGGLAGALALGAPAIVRAAGPKKMILAHNAVPPERAAVVFEWYCKELTARSNGAWQVEYAGNTILTKEIDIINAVKTGNIAMGTPVGAAATIFPEMGVFLVPYLISSYDQAYKTFNGDIGDQLDKTFQEKYGVKVVYFFDFGFRHFWNRVRPITTPHDLRGLKMRVQPSKVFADTINGLGGVAVPVPGAEIYTAAQQGVVDGGDMPVANMVPLKLYEVSKYYSLTNHNYGASLLAINLDVWKSMSSDEQKLLLSLGKEAQARHRKSIESYDSLEGAKGQVEPHGMIVNAGDINAFKEVAKAKVWPLYQDKYKEIWQKLATSA
jgi:tripartite ATP-independent transporter DctP family solute receptor